MFTCSQYQRPLLFLGHTAQFGFRAVSRTKSESVGSWCRFGVSNVNAGNGVC